MSKDALDRLAATIRARRTAASDTSYTRQLLDDPIKSAKKGWRRGRRGSHRRHGTRSKCAHLRERRPALSFSRAADPATSASTRFARPSNNGWGTSGLARQRDRRTSRSWACCDGYKPRRRLLALHHLFAHGMGPLEGGHAAHAERGRSRKSLRRDGTCVHGRGGGRLSALKPFAQSLYVEASQGLHGVTEEFRERAMARCRSSSGSRAASRPGKVLGACASGCWRGGGRAIRTSLLVPTDGFLFPNEVLERRGLMGRKGFSGDVKSAGPAQLPGRREVRQEAGRSAWSTPTLSMTSCKVRRLLSNIPISLSSKGPTCFSPPCCQEAAKPFRSSPTSSTFRSISMRARPLWSIGMSSASTPAVNGLPRSCGIFPPLCDVVGGRGAQDRAVAVALNQSRELAREYLADPPARRSHSPQRRRARRRKRGAEKALALRPGSI